MRQPVFLNILLWMPVMLLGKTDKQPLSTSIPDYSVSVSINDTTDLLDAQNATKWRAYDGKTLPPGWSMSDGMIWVDESKIKGEKINDTTYKGSRDIIFAGQEFEYFELSLEWKISKGGNSGILYHLKEGYGDPSTIGPEYQLIDDVNYAQMHPDLKADNAQFGAKYPELLQDWQRTGADYAMYTPDEKNKVLHAVGEWNTTKIVVASGKTEYWLNGVKLLSFEPWSKDWYAQRRQAMG